jgi:hypothetical protein
MLKAPAMAVAAVLSAVQIFLFNIYNDIDICFNGQLGEWKEI